MGSGEAASYRVASDGRTTVTEAALIKRLRKMWKEERSRFFLQHLMESVRPQTRLDILQNCAERLILARFHELLGSFMCFISFYVY